MFCVFLFELVFGNNKERPFCEATVTLIAKSNILQKKENFKPVSLMNIDTKMLNTFLLQIQTHFVANPAAHKKDHTPQPSWIHPWVKRMVQYTQISQCDTAHQQKKR